MKYPKMGVPNLTRSGFHEKLQDVGCHCQTETDPLWVNWGVDDMVDAG
jgi:hypothetical protein